MVDSVVAEGFERRTRIPLASCTMWCAAKRGSHTYGTNRPESDIDYMFVIVPPLEMRLGWQPMNKAPFSGVEFIENGVDCVFYTLDKLVSMLCRCSPQSLELFGLRDEDYFERHETFRWLSLRRTSFLSRQAVYQTFKGMATSKSTTNAMHPIRLLRMCIELQETGFLRVFREYDADELKAIKTGQWSKDRTDAEIARLLVRAEEALANSILPEHPDYALIRQVVLNIYFEVHNLQYRRPT